MGSPMGESLRRKSRLLTGKQIAKLGFRAPLPVSRLEAVPSIFVDPRHLNRRHIYCLRGCWLGRRGDGQ